jgi:hypothetical protein
MTKSEYLSIIQFCSLHVSLTISVPDIICAEVLYILFLIQKYLDTCICYVIFWCSVFILSITSGVVCFLLRDIYILQYKRVDVFDMEDHFNQHWHFVLPFLLPNQSWPYKA